MGTVALTQLLAALVVSPPRELAFHPLEVRRGPVQPPAVAEQHEQREDQDPDRPEGLVVGPRGRSDHRAEDEQAKSAFCLLEQPQPKLAAPLGELGLPLLAGGWELGEVREERL